MPRLNNGTMQGAVTHTEHLRNALAGRSVSTEGTRVALMTSSRARSVRTPSCRGIRCENQHTSNALLQSVFDKQSWQLWMPI